METVKRKQNKRRNGSHTQNIDSNCVLAIRKALWLRTTWSTVQAL